MSLTRYPSVINQIEVLVGTLKENNLPEHIEYVAQVLERLIQEVYSNVE